MVIEVKEGLFEGATVAAEDGEHAAELGDGGEAGGVPCVGEGGADALMGGCAMSLG
jgi:hypothetical protein